MEPGSAGPVVARHLPSTTCRRAPGLVLAVLAAAALAPAPALAQPQETVHITSVANGERFDSNHPLYDAAARTLTIEGVANGAVDLLNTHDVFVQTQLATPLAADRFFVEMPVGPFQAANLPGFYPYRSIYLSEHHVVMPIVAELVERSTGRVVHRDHIVLYDVRQDEEVETVRTTSLPIASSLGVQLTPAGLDALEAPHLASLPFPDPASLESALAAAVDEQDAAELDLGSGACLDLDADSRFVQTEAYAQALADAAALYAVYLVCEDQGPDAAAAAGAALGGPLGAAIAGAAGVLTCEALCVKAPPTPSDFELCTGRLEGELTSVSVGSVESADLAVTGTGKLTDQAVLTDLEGRANVHLEDVEIRWKRSLCIARPRRDLTPADLAEPSTAAFTTCQGLEIDAARVVPAAADQFEVGAGSCDAAVDPDGEVLECVDAERAAGGSFQYGSAPTRVSAVGTCAEPFIANDASTLLASMESLPLAVLEAAWGRAAPKTDLARAIDALLGPLELGVRPFEDVSLRATWETLDAATGEGLTGSFSTTASLQEPDPAIPESTTFVYRENEKPPVAPGGLTPGGKAFDLSYSISTGLLNQILNARAGTDLLWFEMPVEWARFLGRSPTLVTPIVPGPAPAPPLGPGPITGKGSSTPQSSSVVAGGVTTTPIQPSPGGLVPGKGGPGVGGIGGITPQSGGIAGFAVLHAGDARLVFSPTLSPFTFMPPDLPAEPFPLTWQLGNFIVSVVAGEGRDEEELLRVAVDVYDVDHQVELAFTPGPFLDIGFGSPSWHFTILHSALPGCDLQRFGPNWAGSCESTMQQTLANVIRAALEPRLVELLSQVPAPQLFDVDGLVDPGSAAVFTEVERRQVGSQVVLFGTLDTGP